mgnify:CR=1 FL=1
MRITRRTVWMLFTACLFVPLSVIAGVLIVRVGGYVPLLVILALAVLVGLPVSRFVIRMIEKHEQT